MKRPAVLLLIGLAACVGPARTSGVYESKASTSVEGALSAVQTARMAIRDAIRGDAFATYVSITIQDAEEAASTAEGHFSSIQPPDQASDRLREQTRQLLTQANDLIDRARIAVRRHDTRTLARLDGPLQDLADRLDRFLQMH